MHNTYLDRYQKDNRFRMVAKLIILIVTALAAWISISIPISLRPSEYTLNIGDVSTQDILAPRTLTFTSDLLTAKARSDAEARIMPVYLPVDLEISKSQLLRLKTDLSRIETIRSDLTATEELRVAQLKALTLYGFDDIAAKNLLAMSPTTWDAISARAVSVFESIMSGTVREDLLADHIEKIPNLVG